MIQWLYSNKCKRSHTLYPSLSFFSFFVIDKAVAAPAPPASKAAAAAFRCFDLTRKRFVDGATAWSERSCANFLMTTGAKLVRVDVFFATGTASLSSIFGLLVGGRRILRFVPKYACAYK